MNKIVKGDTVAVIAGKDKGKQGKVMRLVTESGRAIVEGVNYVKKHRRRSQQDQQHAGIVQMEAPIALSNLKVVCKNCNAPVRVAFSVLKDKTKARVCKKCNETL
ncbi:MAG: 50S ribosomal protein L24 [Candidatus Omnitrophota bacterium]